MQIIGFNFTKVSAEKDADFKKGAATTGIEFHEIAKEEIDMLKDLEALKITFHYSITYETEKKKANTGIDMLGNIILASTKENIKQIETAWKNKEIPDRVKIFLFNLILRRCTPKSVMLADEIGLPSLMPYPKITPKPKEEN